MGAAFGLGFIFGPFLGGILSDVGIKISSQPPFGMGFSALGAALLCLLNFMFALKVLKESLTPEKRSHPQHRKSRVDMMFEYFRRPVIGPLLLVGFLATFAMAQMEATLFLLVKDKFSWGLTTAAFAFGWVGVVMVFTQGYLIRKVVAKYGERKLMMVGLIISGIGLVLIGLSPTPLVLGLVVTLMSLGFGLRIPTLNGSLSMLASSQEQGAVMGVNQSLQALGRIGGPPLGGFLYGVYGMESPFLTAGIMTVVGVPILFRLYEMIPDAVVKTDSFGTVVENEKSSSSAFEKPTQPSSSNYSSVKPTSVTAAPTPQPQFRSHAPSPAQPQPSPAKRVINDEPSSVARAVSSATTPSSSSINFIGPFQFRNIFAQNTTFLLVDLRPPESLPQYSRALVTTADNAVSEVAKRVTDLRQPVVIIDEDGASSRAVAEALSAKKYLNLVVLEGGVKSLVLKTPDVD